MLRQEFVLISFEREGTSEHGVDGFPCAFLEGEQSCLLCECILLTGLFCEGRIE